MKGTLKFPFFVLPFLMLTMILSPVAHAEPTSNENVITVNETMQYKQTQITLNKIVIAEDKIKVLFKLKGKQVKDLIVGQKGAVYMHTVPSIKIFDNNKEQLIEGGIGEVGKGQEKSDVLEGIHNISAEETDYTQYYQMNDGPPSLLKIQIMEFDKKGYKNMVAAEFTTTIN